MNTLLVWQKIAHANAVAHGFTEQTVPEMCALMHSEVSELFEAFRKGILSTQCDKAVQLTNAEEELADIVIRACHAAENLGIDLNRAVELKHAYNVQRPFKHGNKAL